ncbi:MAG: flagellar hook-length control protein FliK [Rhodobacteraceae bacterium]|nr:flagellar hook-length control protein FliK [Paracoccaceae bacterium]
MTETAHGARPPATAEPARQNPPLQAAIRHPGTAAELMLAGSPREMPPEPSIETPTITGPEGLRHSGADTASPRNISVSTETAFETPRSDVDPDIPVAVSISSDTDRTSPTRLPNDTYMAAPPIGRHRADPTSTHALPQPDPRHAVMTGSEASAADPEPFNRSQADADPALLRREPPAAPAPDPRSAATQGVQTPATATLSAVAEADISVSASESMSAPVETPAPSQGVHGPRAISGLAIMPPAHQQAAIQSLAAQISSSTSGTGDRELHLRLDPPELGSVRISFSGTDGHLTATVTAERADVEQLLRRHAQDLEGALADAGYEGVNIDFGNGADAPPDEFDGTQIAETSDQIVIEAPTRPEIATLAAADGRLDIRL